MEIEYHPKVIKIDIPKLDKSIKERVKFTIYNKLSTEPIVYGLPLRGTLHQCWKLRVGDYRVVYTIIKDKIKIVIIAHRKNVYRETLKRI